MKKIKIKKHSNFIFLTFKLVFLLQIIDSYNMSKCNDRNFPFQITSVCIEKCPPNESSNKCKIKNEIIETQSLNNILYIGTNGFRYINIAVTENDKLFSIVSGEPASNLRYIYILNREGIGFFSNDGNPTPYTSNNIDDPNGRGRFESTAFTIKLYSITTYKDYLISISIGNQNFELFDYYDAHLFSIPTSSIFGLSDIFSYSMAHLKLSSNDNTNTYIIGFLASESSSLGTTKNFYLNKVKFNSIDIISELPNIINQKVPSSNSKIVSCYETSTNFIVCFYKDQNNDYIIIVYSLELEIKNNFKLAEGDSNDDIFFKCTHFFNEAGAFAYFTNDSNRLLKFQFKKYLDGSISDLYTEIPYIILENYYLNLFVTLSDLTKATDKKIYYVGVSIDKKILYVISIINYLDYKFVTRIYRINFYNLYNKVFYKDLNIGVYRNSLTMGSSFNYDTDNSIYSSIIIFSYPNSTDISFNIDNYLFNNNNIKIDNLILELNGNCIMENNIFGYNSLGIEIVDNCKDLTDIYLATLDNEKIENTFFLEKNTKIKLNIPGNSLYNAFSCQFKYSCIFTEPEYEEFNNYPEKIIYSGGDNEEVSHFNNQKTKYLGKYSNYILNQVNQLTTENCEENCELCYSTNKSCVTCQYSFTIEDGKKSCDNEPSEMSSEIQTTDVKIPTTDSIDSSDTEIS